MKYFFIAGEASGDLHAANLMAALKMRDHQPMFVGLGGDKMRAQGCKLYVDYRDMAYMGFVAVLQNLDKIKRNFRIAKQALLDEQPDVLVLVDYPSFNLKIAKYCKKHLPATRIVYYIPPKVWAWKKWRVHKIAQLSDKVLGIFPFEPAFFAQYGYKCEYVGNPVADSIRTWRQKAVSELDLTGQEASGKEVIAILPGSRKSEISKCLPTMLAAARRVVGDKYRIVVTAAPGVDDAFYAPYLQDEQLTRDTYTLLAQAHAAVVNSGTATLETALIGCPQTAVYYVAGSKYLEKLLKPIMFSIKHFTLVNIIPDKEVIQELVASRFTQENVEQELRRLVEDEPYRAKMKMEYEAIWQILGERSAAEGAAEFIG
ncbi:MAG: lipid-A-disaccharide synthase [Paludibacteraceae bacterium]|nr:lipid-A-disaccharide synthase [Paludibacteraceae bacterium]